MRFHVHLFACAGLLTAGLAHADKPRPPADPTKLSATGAYSQADQAPVMSKERKRRMKAVETAPGVWQVDNLIVNAGQRSISIPVSIGETKSQLEYTLVNGSGKTHESLFLTDVFPTQLHVAALLLSVTDGTPVEITVHWGVNGPKKSSPLSQLLRIEGIEAQKIRWTYQANKLTDGSLSAEMDQSLITLIDDPNALIHHASGADLKRDDIYFPNGKGVLPEKGLPLTMTLTFPKLEK